MSNLSPPSQQIITRSFLTSCTNNDLSSLKKMHGDFHLVSDKALHLGISVSFGNDHLPLATYLLDFALDRKYFTKNNYGWLFILLNSAIKTDSVKVVSHLMSRPPLSKAFLERDTIYLLRSAALSGSINCVKHLSSIIDPKQECSSPLAISLLQGHDSIVKHLIPLSNLDDAFRSLDDLSDDAQKIESAKSLILKYKSDLDRKTIHQNIKIKSPSPSKIKII